MDRFLRSEIYNIQLDNMLKLKILYYYQEKLKALAPWETIWLQFMVNLAKRTLLTQPRANSIVHYSVNFIRIGLRVQQAC